MGNCPPSCRNRWNSGSGFWTAHVIAIPGEIFPDVIKHFSYNAHRGEAVIDEAIVEGIAAKLVYEQTYQLDAYSKIGDYLQNPPEGTEVFQFKIIVDAQPPALGE